MVRATAKAAGGRVWILTDRGAFRSTTTGFEPLEVGPRRLEPRQPPVQGGARITALASDSLGHIWVGTDRGVYITNSEEWWQKLGRADGVPYENITCLHIAPGGDVWAGTNEGAWRLRDGYFRYFWGRHGSVTTTSRRSGPIARGAPGSKPRPESPASKRSR